MLERVASTKPRPRTVDKENARNDGAGRGFDLNSREAGNQKVFDVYDGVSKLRCAS